MYAKFFKNAKKMATVGAVTYSSFQGLLMANDQLVKAYPSLKAPLYGYGFDPYLNFKTLTETREMKGPVNKP